MPTQNDFLRVRERLIEPLSALFARQYGEVQIDAIVEDAARFSNDCYERAVKDLRRTESTLPKIAKIIAACEKHEMATRPPENPQPSKHSINHAAAERFIRSALGQECLRGGFGHSAYRHVEDTGDEFLREKSLEYLRISAARARAAAREVETKAAHCAMSRSLHSLWRTMEARELEMQEKYLAYS